MERVTPWSRELNVTNVKRPSIIDTQSKSYLPYFKGNRPKSVRSHCTVLGLACFTPDSSLSQIDVLFTDSESSQNQVIFVNADSPLTFSNKPASASEVLSTSRKNSTTLFYRVKNINSQGLYLWTVRSREIFVLSQVHGSSSYPAVRDDKHTPKKESGTRLEYFDERFRRQTNFKKPFFTSNT